MGAIGVSGERLDHNAGSFLTSSVTTFNNGSFWSLAMGAKACF